MSRPPIRVTMTAVVDVPEGDYAHTDVDDVVAVAVNVSAGRAHDIVRAVETLSDGSRRITVTARLGEYRPLWEPEETTGPAPEPVPLAQLFGPEESS
ncbi:hypothetical protein [Actinoalloteichus sp. GBA129-24]|uniref:hypothetical protein n=1 Tax=Actinoalloteichus sp. GBA129-24 TaxID=1612551 RepID=UPI00095057DE|nr:hypothetical protein [Actinoalloteichus sp. GBA129-24]APU20925.1 hypothetical protein UA75_14575 [Actinoalloteichus sp. GBA129-24]APU24174.1 hypothetical protein UA75_31055 [Actinoalloteichus sp. GBA129-24]